MNSPEGSPRKEGEVKINHRVLVSIWMKRRAGTRSEFQCAFEKVSPLAQAGASPIPGLDIPNSRHPGGGGGVQEPYVAHVAPKGAIAAAATGAILKRFLYGTGGGQKPTYPAATFH